MLAACIDVDNSDARALVEAMSQRQWRWIMSTKSSVVVQTRDCGSGVKRGYGEKLYYFVNVKQ